MATLLFCLFALSAATKIAVLSNHDPVAWSKSNATCLHSGAQDLDAILCNLAVYGLTIQTAASQGVQLLVFPEAYALNPNPSTQGFFEQLSDVGSNPCSANATALPQQHRISCLCKQYKIAVAFNMFSSLKNGTRRITEVVVDPSGQVVALYDKHHLFVSEVNVFTPGPFQPTTVSLFGRVYGLIICWEGVYPFVSNDFAQMDGLVAKNASAFLWSIGGAVPMTVAGSQYVKKYGVDVVATEDSAEGVLLCAKQACPTSDLPIVGLTSLGYTAKAMLRSATM